MPPDLNLLGLWLGKRRTWSGSLGWVWALGLDIICRCSEDDFGQAGKREGLSAELMKADSGRLDVLARTMIAMLSVHDRKSCLH